MKKKNYEVDIQTADQMLQNVFAACDTAPNSIPFEKIVSRDKLNFRFENSIIIATFAIIILTVLAPLCFPPSKGFLSVDPYNGRPLTIIDHSLIGETFSISFEGAPVDLSNTYMVGDSGTVLSPISYDREKNTLEFPFEDEEYNIYITDINGKTLHLLLTPR